MLLKSGDLLRAGCGFQGDVSAEILEKVAEIAREYGNGTVHIATRQGFEIPGIPFELIPKINETKNYSPSLMHRTLTSLCGAEDILLRAHEMSLHV